MQPKSISSIDDVRAAHPDVGVAIYAMTPGGPVTLELHTPDGQFFTFKGETSADAFALAFPAPEVSEMPNDEPNIFD